jgi:hypothetical protein
VFDRYKRAHAWLTSVTHIAFAWCIDNDGFLERVEAALRATEMLPPGTLPSIIEVGAVTALSAVASARQWVRGEQPD